MNNRQLQGDARWLNADGLKRGTLPRQAACWLLDKGSLTKRVITACGGRFRVQPLGQSWQRPLREEAKMLGIATHSWVLARHVLLMCDDTPWIYARTVMPKKTLTGRHRRLARLGDKPLGAVLFADKYMSRGPVEVANLKRGMSLFKQIEQATPCSDDEVWGRRSLFKLGVKPLLVYEIFLPEVGECDE